MEALRIGFIQANQKTDVQWFKPLAFGYLKAYLDKYLENPPLFEFINDLSNIDKYNIIAISSTSQDYSEAKRIAASIKQRNSSIITILGGHHVTYLPFTLSPDFDLGIMGEGEQTFLELIQYFQNHGIDNGQGLKNIKGLAIREGGKITLTGKRDLIEPLDSIPHPYRQSNDTQYLFTSRGCPYKCAFCSSSAFWNKTRVFSAEYVVDEIEQILTRFPETKHIPIEDDIFIIDLPRLEKIIALLGERGLNRKISFSFAVRANLVNDKLCELIKRLNIKAVCFGAESGSDRILEILKPRATVAQNQNALDILRKHNIPVVCSFIVGIPTETEEEVRATYDFVTRNIIERKLGSFSTVNILTPMPGTEIWNYAIDCGLINISDMEWSRLAGFASYRTSNINSFPEWVKHREDNKSIYLNEDTLPQHRLYEIMNEYEGKIKNIERMILNGKDLNIHPESELAHKYCIGKGLEIGGAAHNPFSLDTLNVDITDSMETKFKKEEIRLCNRALPVDIVAPGDEIPLPDASQDFIINSHVLEHFTNPIKALIEWNRLLKPGGIIFMIVPHKERTADKEKSRTTLQHLIDDYQAGTTESNGDENGHEHVWITEDIVNLVSWMIENLNMKWTLEEVQDKDDKVGNGFCIIIRKQGVCLADTKITIGFGVLINDPIRFDMVLRQSEIDGKMFFIREPHSATSGLNKLLDLLRHSGADVAALVHQDMYFDQGWLKAVRSQLARLPGNWIVAGIIGKDQKGLMCGRLHDMRMPFMFDSDHRFPVEASCFDECCILVNLKSKFRFDERLDGFDLYGTLAVLQAEEMGGTAWIIDAFAEHYCLRPFPWRPGPEFFKRLNWIRQRFPDARRIDSTVLIDGKIFNPGEYPGKEETLCLSRVGG